MIEFVNPEAVHAPVGAYAHTAVVPAGVELVFVAGQVGMRGDGSVPAPLDEQADAAFANLLACLADHGLGPEAVVKLNTYVVAGQDLQVVREARERRFGGHRPTATLVFVAGLVDPGLLLEVDAIAVRAVG